LWRGTRSGIGRLARDQKEIRSARIAKALGGAIDALPVAERLQYRCVKAHAGRQVAAA